MQAVPFPVPAASLTKQCWAASPGQEALSRHPSPPSLDAPSLSSTSKWSTPGQAHAGGRAWGHREELDLDSTFGVCSVFVGQIHTRQ